jgi:hypothetical protein
MADRAIKSPETEGFPLAFPDLSPEANFAPTMKLAVAHTVTKHDETS